MQNIVVHHTGRIMRSHPKELHPEGMLWSRDMRFFFTNVPAGEYDLELQMNETGRVDAGAADARHPTVDIFIDHRRVAQGVTAHTPTASDPHVSVTLPVTVKRSGFDLRILATIGGLNLPCIVGMKLRRGEEVVHEFAVGDPTERAMWTAAETNPAAAAVRTDRYEAVMNSGVSLGGIGTGKVEILTNGTLGAFSTNNNWDIPVNWVEGSFFAIHCQTKDQSRAMLLTPPRSAGGYDLPTAKAVQYQGLYPRADLSYELPDVPLDVRLRAAGTVTPGDADASSLPGATFTFTVTNIGSASARASLLMSLENIVGRGGWRYVSKEWQDFAQWYESVEGACQAPWECDGLTGVRFGCKRKPADVKEANLFTEYALACEGDNVRQCVGWNVLADKPAFWDAFAAEGSLPAGDDRPGADGEYIPAGAVARTVELAPGESKDVVFVLAWKHNGHTTFRDEVNHGHAYDKRCPSLETVARAVAANREQARQMADTLETTLAEGGLPSWLTTKMLNGGIPTTVNSIWTANDFFSIHESPTDMAGAVGTIDQRMASHPHTFTFFPELDRLELDWFRRCQLESGEIPHMIGNVYDMLGSTDTFFCITGWPDLSSSFIFQVYKHFLYTGDRAYLERNFPAFEKAIAWIRSTDTYGWGLPVGGCTYDYDADDWKVGAPMIFNASCYLGALRAAIAAAQRLGRDDRAAEWQGYFDQAHNTLMNRYWNGRYFRKWVHPEGHEKNNCFVSQLAGDWIARILGLEPIFSDEIVDTCLESILQLNVRPYHPTIIMEATPTGERAEVGCYVQQHEPYLGMELIYRGRVKAGLDVLKRRQDIAWRVNANPWAQALGISAPVGWEVGLTDYMTAAAPWNLPAALAGMTVDAEQGLLRFAPQFDGRRHVCVPVFLQDLWLILDADRPSGSAAVRVVHRGANAPSLSKAIVEIEGRAPQSVTFND